MLVKKRLVHTLCLKSTWDFGFHSQVVPGMDVLSWSKKNRKQYEMYKMSVLDTGQQPAQNCDPRKKYNK